MEASALKTHAFTRSARINERQGCIRARARENKVACINAAFSTLSFFKLLATGEQRGVLAEKFHLRVTVRNAIIQNILIKTTSKKFAAKCKTDFYSARIPMLNPLQRN